MSLLARLALALGIGLTIGIERGWHMREAPAGTRVAGVRTFTLIGLLGGLLGVAGQAVNDVIIAVGLFGFFALIAVTYFSGAARSEERGMTTEVAELITFILGLIAVRGDMIVAAVIAVITVAILDLKSHIHGWIENVQSAELKAAIKLLLMSVVVLPLLPNEDLGPGGVLNPYRIWWVVVIIAGLSFAAYAAIRVAGPKAGAALTGLLGGLASSTAVALSCARMAVRTPRLADSLGGAIALACAVMFLRGLVVITILFKPAANILAAPLIAAVIGAAGTGIYLFRFGMNGPSGAPGIAGPHVDLGPPSDIDTAVKFGLILAAVGLAAHYGKEFFGSGGLLASAALSGVVDIDAVTITMSKFGQAGTESPESVALAVTIAVAVNSAAKMVYVLAIARRVMIKQALLIFAVPTILGAAAYFVSRAM